MGGGGSKSKAAKKAPAAAAVKTVTSKQSRLPKPEKIGFTACTPSAFGDSRFGNATNGSLDGQQFVIKSIPFISNDKQLSEQRAADATAALNVAATLTLEAGFAPVHEHHLGKHGVNLVYQHIPGEMLADWVAKHRPLKQSSEYEEKVGKIILQLLEAALFLHTKGLCHWNLHPSNVLILNGSKVVILEACLGPGFEWRERVEGLGEEGRMLRSYIAPELLVSSATNTSGVHYTTQCDMYSIGAILAYMFSGKDLFSRSQSDVISFREFDKKKFRAAFLTTVKSFWASMSAVASDFLCRLLQFDPVTRADAAQAMKLPWCRQLLGQPSIDPHLFAALELHLSFSTLLPTAMLARGLKSRIIFWSRAAELAGKGKGGDNKSGMLALRTLRAQLQERDGQHSGLVTVEELRGVLKDKAAFRRGSKLEVTLPKEGQDSPTKASVTSSTTTDEVKYPFAGLERALGAKGKQPKQGGEAQKGRKWVLDGSLAWLQRTPPVLVCKEEETRVSLLSKKGADARVWLDYTEFIVLIRKSLVLAQHDHWPLLEALASLKLQGGDGAFEWRVEEGPWTRKEWGLLQRRQKRRSSQEVFAAAAAAVSGGGGAGTAAAGIDSGAAAAAAAGGAASGGGGGGGGGESEGESAAISAASVAAATAAAKLAEKEDKQAAMIDRRSKTRRESFSRMMGASEKGTLGNELVAAAAAAEAAAAAAAAGGGGDGDREGEGRGDEGGGEETEAPHLALPGTVQGSSGYYEMWDGGHVTSFIAKFEVTAGEWTLMEGPWTQKEWAEREDSNSAMVAVDEDEEAGEEEAEEEEEEENHAAAVVRREEAMEEATGGRAKAGVEEQPVLEAVAAVGATVTEEEQEKGEQGGEEGAEKGAEEATGAVAAAVELTASAEEDERYEMIKGSFSALDLDGSGEIELEEALDTTMRAQQVCSSGVLGRPSLVLHSAHTLTRFTRRGLT
jgi:hypothetical protein